jgi:DNA-binding NarL/FixJ family response regulator
MFESSLEAAAEAVAEAVSDALAGAAVVLAGAAADVVAAGGAEDVELDPELHAASARQLTVAVTARNGLMERMFMGDRPPEDRFIAGGQA